MIRITIDKSAATPEDRVALEATSTVQAMVAEVAHTGRHHGIALVVVEPVAAEVYSMLRSVYPADQITPEKIRATLPQNIASA